MDLMSDLIVATRRGDKLMAETNPGGGGGHHQQGILLDRATSVIIGETDIVGDNVPIHNRQTAGDWKVIACLAAHMRRQGAQRRPSTVWLLIAHWRMERNAPVNRFLGFAVAASVIFTES
jgi:hypothetical protein